MLARHHAGSCEAHPCGQPRRAHPRGCVREPRDHRPGAHRLGRPEGTPLRRGLLAPQLAPHAAAHDSDPDYGAGRAAERVSGASCFGHLRLLAGPGPGGGAPGSAALGGHRRESGLFAEPGVRACRLREHRRAAEAARPIERVRGRGRSVAGVGRYFGARNGRVVAIRFSVARASLGPPPCTCVLECVHGALCKDHRAGGLASERECSRFDSADAWVFRRAQGLQRHVAGEHAANLRAVFRTARA
mmetsp:Transcript_15427/g.44595  ORF Transcript_15427/g.44595 Transcript_15427/m.44595 type:complete len:245 (+) Transcript_15427:1568-2302(+)